VEIDRYDTAIFVGIFRKGYAAIVTVITVCYRFVHQVVIVH